MPIKTKNCPIIDRRRENGLQSTTYLVIEKHLNTRRHNYLSTKIKVFLPQNIW